MDTLSENNLVGTYSRHDREQTVCKNNEEQFKHNAKVICKLDEATENINALNVEKGK